MKVLVRAFDIFLFSAAALVVWGWLADVDYLFREILLFGLVAVGTVATAYAFGFILLAVIAFIVILSSKSAKEKFWKGLAEAKVKR